MSIENQQQYENTRAKLQELEQLYERKRQEPTNDHIRELTLRSLKQRINQFQEEMARFETRTCSPARNSGDAPRWAK